MKAPKESVPTPVPDPVAHADLLGAHVSTAGGVDKSIARAVEIGCTAVQIFTRNPSQWSSPPISDETARAFRESLAASPIRAVVSHDSYLINLATPDADLAERSIAAMVDEIDRADILGIPVVVTHLGGHMGAGDDAGLALLAERLDRVADRRPDSRVKIALETTAGQGTSLGWRFEHIAEVFARVAEPNRLSTCFDTCHVHVAGYDIVTEEGFAETWREFDRIVGMQRLVAIHLNDAKKARGARVDRHEHIGKGTIGDTPFLWIVKNRMFADIPKLVETPDAETMHRVNVAHLRDLAADGGGRSASD